MVVLDENSKPVRHVKRYVYENGLCFTLSYIKNIEKYMTTVLKIKFISIEWSVIFSFSDILKVSNFLFISKFEMKEFKDFVDNVKNFMNKRGSL